MLSATKRSKDYGRNEMSETIAHKVSLVRSCFEFNHTQIWFAFSKSLVDGTACLEASRMVRRGPNTCARGRRVPSSCRQSPAQGSKARHWCTERGRDGRSAQVLAKRPSTGQLRCPSLAGALSWCSKCLESGRSRLLLRFHLRYVQPHDIAPPGVVSVGREC